jgi:hypothetical protein
MKTSYYHNHLFYEYPLPKEIDDLLDRTSINRCPRCGSILFIGEFGKGTKIEIECRKCKLKNVIVSSV